MPSAALAGALEALAPPACVACGADVDSWSEPLCPVCEDTVVPVEPPACTRCGVPFGGDGGGERECGRCAAAPPGFDEARAWAWYGGGVEALLVALKFHGRRDLAPLLAGRAVAAVGESLASGRWELVAPVPLGRPRLRRRGYDQAWLLARAVARELALPAHPRAAVRLRDTAPQTGLTASRREANMAGAFGPGPADAVSGRRVLLVDDVMTTGATASACAGALRAAGAAAVGVLTIARAV